MDAMHPIRKARNAKRLTQAALAQKLGVTKAAVSQWELGNKAPSPALALRLAALLPKLTLQSIYASTDATQKAA